MLNILRHDTVYVREMRGSDVPQEQAEPQEPPEGMSPKA